MCAPPCLPSTCCSGARSRAARCCQRAAASPPLLLPAQATRSCTSPCHRARCLSRHGSTVRLLHGRLVRPRHSMHARSRPLTLAAALSAGVCVCPCSAAGPGGITLPGTRGTVSAAAAVGSLVTDPAAACRHTGLLVTDPPALTAAALCVPALNSRMQGGGRIRLAGKPHEPMFSAAERAPLLEAPVVVPLPVTGHTIVSMVMPASCVNSLGRQHMLGATTKALPGPPVDACCRPHLYHILQPA